HTRETALYFARGEINAILAGNHRTQGKPTAPDPQRLIIEALAPEDREYFTERAALLEHDGGLNRADAEARALREIISRKYPAPEKPVYRGAAAIKCTLAAGIPLKDFYAKSKDNDPAAYTADQGEIAGLWEQGRRKLKAFIRGRFVVIDVDRKPGKADGLESLYRLFPPDIMPQSFRDIAGGSFPCYATTPSNGYHLYFKYDGPELKFRELADGVEVKEWQIAASGSDKETGPYILYGEFTDAPPLYGVILDHIEAVKRKQEREKAERAKPRTRAVADRPVRHTPRITLDDLAGEAAAAYAGHHDRQVSFAGRAYRCKFSGAETLAYVKVHPEIFGNDADTEKTILSVFRDDGGCR
ncbi:MAG: bifunctional DNA primase/polymerase, partial [Treponema sp.]|nr:bifunctional DNA primase/polymerase [Treponema sp.]